MALLALLSPPSLLILGVVFAISAVTFLRPLIAKLLGSKIQHDLVGFFHPYTNDGGGGEKVLWCAVRAIQEEVPHARILIFTGDEATPEFLAQRALDRFGITLARPVEVLLLYNRIWIEASTFPRFTLACQSFGSVVLAWEALRRLTPALFVDTAGFAFTYPVAALFGCQVACYTHYPTISTDMLQRVQERQPMYNNSSDIANSPFLSEQKALYYKVMAWLYGVAGSYASVVMVNSSWTEGHIRELWRPKRLLRVYPPCDTSALQSLPLERPERKGPYIISVAQFRPEKAHSLQLQAFQLALRGDEDRGEDGKRSPLGGLRLKLLGSCRHKEDEQRIEMLSSLAYSLGIDSKVDFITNASYKDLRSLLGGAIAGLHTMTDEHFGISIVEYMAAGAIPIAHNSGGPKQDILLEEGGEPTGFLATTVDEFAAAITHVADMSPQERAGMAEAARKRAQRFSEANFYKAFKGAMRALLSQTFPSR